MISLGVRVAAIVLAAGASRRLGRPKQLLPFRGEPLLRAIAREARASSSDHVAVVLGAHADQVRAAIVDCDVTPLECADWSEGIAATIRTGIGWAERNGFDAALLLTCDQRALSASHIDRLIAAHRPGVEVVASRYADTLGIPALFARALFPRLLELRGDVGAKRVIRASTAVDVVDWPEGALDIDTPDDAATAGITETS